MFSSHTFLASLAAVKLVAVCFVGCYLLREKGDVFLSDSQGWKHKARLIKAFVLFCFVLSFNGFKSPFTLSVMVLKLKQIIFPLLVFFFTGAFKNLIFSQRSAVCMACCNAPSHGKKTLVYL